jgi:hypothetical protein
MPLWPHQTGEHIPHKVYAPHRVEMGWRSNCSCGWAVKTATYDEAEEVGNDHIRENASHGEEA